MMMVMMMVVMMMMVVGVSLWIVLLPPLIANDNDVSSHPPVSFDSNPPSPTLTHTHTDPLLRLACMLILIS